MSQDFKIQVAERKRVKLRIGISAPSGGGKTYSALTLAYGMTNDWSKIIVIDTENDSASLYSHLGKFNVLALSQPYSPERYIGAIKACEDAGAEVIIIDSVSHEWDGKGGCLEIQTQLGGRYTDWKEITPRHNKFIDKINHSTCHIITTARRKIDYVVEQNDKGKAVPKKAGMKEVQREGFEYELTINFGLEVPSHMARAEKDRTGLFMDEPAFIIGKETGRRLIEWANGGSAEYYVASTDQMKEFAKLCAEFKITDKPTMKSLSDKFKGKVHLENIRGALSQVSAELA